MELIDEKAVACDLLDVVEHERPQPLDRCTLPSTAALYLLTYCPGKPGPTDQLAPHQRLAHRYLRESGWPIYCGAAANVRSRRGRYLSSLATCRTLDASDLEIAIVPTGSHAQALYYERLMIGMWEPLLNESWLGGFGSSRDQGTARRSQRLSAFATMFGRRGHGVGTRPPRRTYDELVVLAEAHLSRTVGDTRLIRRYAA